VESLSTEHTSTAVRRLIDGVGLMNKNVQSLRNFASEQDQNYAILMTMEEIGRTGMFYQSLINYVLQENRVDTRSLAKLMCVNKRGDASILLSGVQSCTIPKLRDEALSNWVENVEKQYVQATIVKQVRGVNYVYCHPGYISRVLYYRDIWHFIASVVVLLEDCISVLLLYSCV